VSLPHILLALVADRPASGYALKKRIDDELSPFWNAELSQIYPVLDSLRRAGWLAETAIAPSRGPATRRFRATATGRRELAAWMLAAAPIDPVRDPALARLVLRRGLGAGGAASLADDEEAVSSEIARQRKRTGSGLTAASREVALARLEGLRRWLRSQGAPARPRRSPGRPRRRAASLKRK
jgi:DNA-binding PadR family transcriptional regulator